LASWLYGIAHRVSLDAKKQAASRRRREAQAAAPLQGPPDEATWSEVRTILDGELVKLPEKLRLPLILCYLEGRSRDEAAEQLGWSKSTLMRRLAEARVALRRRLLRKGIIGSAAMAGVLISDCAAPAALPATLIGSTVQAACVPLGSAPAAVVSANVAALTQGVLKAMFISKMKSVVAVLVLGGGLLSGGSAIVAYGVITGTERQPIVVREDAQVSEVAWSADGSAVATINVTFELIENQALEVPESPARVELIPNAPKAPTKLLWPHMDVKLWDAKTAELIKTLGTAELMKTVGEKNRHHISAIAFSPDRRHAVMAGDEVEDNRAPRHFVRLFDAKTWAIEQELEEEDALGVGALAFSPDGKTLAMGGMNSTTEDGSFVKLWDIEADKITSATKFAAKTLISANPVALKRPEWHVQHLAFSPDGKTLAAGEYGLLSHRARIRLYDAATGASEREWEVGESKGLASVAFADGGKSLVSACGAVKFWDVRTGEELRSLDSGGFECECVAVSHDGRHVAASAFRTEGENFTSKVLLWDAKTGELKQTLDWQVPGMFTSSIAFSPDGKSLAIGGETSPDVRVEGSEKVKGELKLISLD
jgi:WD40 repeat protein